MPAGKGSGHTSRRAPAARPTAVPTMEISLVRALVALLTERSVSRAAESLNQAQPQMSATLKRLRELVHDPILVRGARGMVVTEHALTLLEPARRILGDMQLLMSESPRFDPLEVRRTLRLAIPDYISAALLGAILGAIRVAAPGASTLVLPVRGDADGVALLESGKADLLIESNLVQSANVHSKLLFEDAILCVAAKSHPGVRRGITVEEYLALPHVAASPDSGTGPGLIDRMLAERGLARRVVAWVPYLNTLPQVLAQSDLVLTTSAHLARQFALDPALQAFAPPVKLPAMRYHIMWHERVHRSREHRWLRGLVQTAAATLITKSA